MENEQEFSGEIIGDNGEDTGTIIEDNNETYMDDTISTYSDISYITLDETQFDLINTNMTFILHCNFILCSLLLTILLYLFLHNFAERRKV